jgi:hypothetical protein
VLRARSSTFAAGTARICHAIRVGGADGRLDGTEHPGEGDVDFRRRRVRYPSTLVVGKAEYVGETLWDGPRQLTRDSPGGSWTAIPNGRPTELVPFGSPLWLMYALSGVRDDAQPTSEENVRGVRSRRIALSIDSSTALDTSEVPIDFPRQRGEVFAAEIWIDTDGFIRRVGCALVPAWKRKRYSRRTRWITTEFWDFGVAAIIDVPPLH